MDLEMTKGHQALQNRLACIKEIVEPWLDQESELFENLIIFNDDD